MKIWRIEMLFIKLVIVIKFLYGCYATFIPNNILGTFSGNPHLSDSIQTEIVPFDNFMSPFGYIYKITNNINGKNYIGATIFPVKQRWESHIRDANRGVDYHLHRTIRKYGKDNFSVKQIKKCYSKNDLYENEKYYIDRFDSFRNGMNMTIGGEGAPGHIITEKTRQIMSEVRRGRPGPMVGKKHSEKTKRTIGKTSKKRWADPEYQEKMSKMKKGKKWTKEQRKNLLKVYNDERRKGRISGDKNPMFGKKHSQETKEKIREKAVDRKPSLETRIKMSKAKIGQIPWNKGISCSEEIKEKIRNKNIGKKHSKESIKLMSKKRKEWWENRKGIT